MDNHEHPLVAHPTDVPTHTSQLPTLTDHTSTPHQSDGPQTTPQHPKYSRYIMGVIFVSLIGMVAILSHTLLNAGTKETNVPKAGTQTFSNPFDNVSIEGQAGIVLDLQSETILFSKHASTSLPLASVTKLMSAYTALVQAPHILTITIDLSDILIEGDQGLIIGETWRLDDLLDFSLVTSSNDAMHAIARTVGGLSYGENGRERFITLMNQTAQNLGLSSMRFVNETGLDEEETGDTGGIGSAYDVAQLIGILTKAYPDAITRTRDTEFSVSSLSGRMHVGRNTNMGAAAIPGLLASKTGYTDLAGGNLAIVYNQGLHRPIAIVVLGSTPEGRFADVETLVRATHAYVLSKPSNSL